MPSRERDVVLIAGVVATIQVVVRTGEQDEGLYRSAVVNRLVLQKDINGAVHATLGEGFYCIQPQYRTWQHTLLAHDSDDGRCCSWWVRQIRCAPEKHRQTDTTSKEPR